MDETGGAAEPGDLTGAPTPDIVRVAQRVLTLRGHRAESPEESEGPAATPSASGRKRRSSFEVLVFDTETRITPDQSLMMLVSRLYIDPPHGTPAATLIEELIVYPDGLPESDPAGYALLVAYAASHEPAQAEALRNPNYQGIPLVSLSWWLDRRLYRYGYEHRDRCDVVGFNLVFDFGATARYWAPAERAYRGGWSLGFWGHYTPDGKWSDAKFRPRLLMRAIDPRRTLIGWGSLGIDEYPKGSGRFVDLRTLVFALTDNATSLETACRAFQIGYTKADVDHGELSAPLVDYARADVEATGRLYAACQAELLLHEGVTLEAHKLYSPASVGSAVLRAMGLTPAIDQHTTISPAERGKQARKKRRKASATEGGG